MQHIAVDALDPQVPRTTMEESMRKFVLATLAALRFSRQCRLPRRLYFGAGPGGAGFQVGPFGFGVGPRYYRKLRLRLSKL